jgi:alpha,alpha-trehalase
MTEHVDASRFDAVVFDMDGVITDSASVHAHAWKRMFDEYLAEHDRASARSAAPFDADDYLRYVDGRPRDDGVSGFLASRGITLPRGNRSDPPEAETIWGLANRKNEAFLRTVENDGVKAFPSSVRLVESLQARGIGTAVISASRNAQTILDAAGVGSLFAVRVDGVELERLGLPGKPDPAMFVEATRRLGASPDRSVIVEDAIAGVEAGRRGQFALVIGVDRVGQADRLRKHGADVVVTDLAEVVVDD